MGNDGSGALLRCWGGRGCKAAYSRVPFSSSSSSSSSWPHQDETTAASVRPRIERFGSHCRGISQANASPRRLSSRPSDGPYCADDIQHQGESSQYHTGPCRGGRKMEPSSQQRAGKINRTLRHTLLIFVLDTLLARLAEKDSLQHAAKQGWLVSQTAQQAEMAADAQWAYMMWKETKLQAASELAPWAKSNSSGIWRECGPSWSNQGLILRFSATRPLTAEMSGHSVTLLLELSLQDPRASQNYADDEEVVCSGSLAAYWSKASSGPHRTVAADEGNPGTCVWTGAVMEAGNCPVPQASPLTAGTLINLRLSNPDNLCYLHSVIHLTLYVLPLMPTGLQPTGMFLTTG